jgi:hypothetical protein
MHAGAIVFLPNRGFFGGSLMAVPFLLELRRRVGGPILGASPCPEHRRYVAWGAIDELLPYAKPWSALTRAAVARTRQVRPAVVASLRPGCEWVQVWMLAIRAHERWSFRRGLWWAIDRRGIPWDDDTYRADCYRRLGGGAPGPGDLLAGWPDARSAPATGLVLLPSGQGAHKHWPLEHYAAVARWWLAHRPGPVTVIAGPGDGHVPPWCTSTFAGDARVRLIHGAAFADEVAAIRAATAVVQNDCGPGHIAQMVDVPRVVLFEDRVAPGEWFRPGPRSRFLRAAPGTPIATIGVDAVVQALEQVA